MAEPSTSEVPLVPMGGSISSPPSYEIEPDIGLDMEPTTLRTSLDERPPVGPSEIIISTGSALPHIGAAATDGAIKVFDPFSKDRIKDEFRLYGEQAGRMLDATQLVVGAASSQEQLVFSESYTDKIRQLYLYNNMWLFLTVLGIAGGLCGFFNDICTRYMFLLRSYIMGTVLKEEPVMFRYVAWVAWMMVSSSISMFLVWLSPGSAAEGSGVAHVKALLHHWVFTPEIFCWQTWLIKLIGLSFSVGCGLWLGKVDVHIAVILCVLLLKLPIFKNINDCEEDRYQMYVCASCVGLGVNFGVPISAVLFGLELSGSYYRSKIYLKAIYCATFAAFVARYLAALVAGKSHITVWINVAIRAPGWEYTELPGYLALGVVCGCLGALFVWWNEQMIKLKKQYGTKRIPFLFDLEFKYVWGMFIVFLVATASFPGTFGQFLSLGSAGTVEDLGLENMAGPAAKAKDWHNGNFFMNLGITFVLRFILSTLLTTCPIPGGPYTPFLVVGAALGRLWAETLVYLFPAWGVNVEPNAYSLVAAAALTAGATHQRFSSAVIVLELAGMTMMFPLLICVAISTYVANSLFIPLADSIIRMRGWTSYNDLKGEFQNIAISDLMVTDPEVLCEKSTLEDVTAIMKASPEVTEFAVVDTRENMVLLGIVYRKMLNEFLTRYQQQAEQNIDEGLADQSGVRARGEVTSSQRIVDLGEIIQPVPISLHEHIPLVSLHACVVLTRLTSVYITRKARLVGVFPISLLKKYCA